MNYKCPKCSCIFENEQENCPNCGVKFVYKKETQNSKYQCPKCNCVFFGKLSNCPVCHTKFTYNDKLDDKKAEEIIDDKQESINAPVSKDVASQEVVSDNKSEPENTTQQVSEPVVEEQTEETSNVYEQGEVETSNEEPKKKKEKGKKSGFHKFMAVIGWILFVLLIIALIYIVYVILACANVIPDSIKDPIDNVLDYVPGFGKGEITRQWIVKVYNWLVDGINMIIDNCKSFYSNLFNK